MQVISIAQKFASQRELLFTSMEQKYRDQGLYVVVVEDRKMNRCCPPFAR